MLPRHASGFTIKCRKGKMDFGNTYDAVLKQTVEARRRSQRWRSLVFVDHIKIINSTVIANLSGACSPVRAVANSAAQVSELALLDQETKREIMNSPIYVIVQVREANICKTN